MRLLKTGAFVSENPTTVELHDLPVGSVRYAVLSHVWTSPQGEILFSDLLDACDTSIRRLQGHLAVHLATSTLPQKPGWAKLAFALEQADKDGKEWLWVDTACIDRSSSSELAESINARWQWLQGAAICYALLGDVPLERWREMKFIRHLASSWFDDGWTLSALIAPGHVVFYSKEWSRLGDKHELARVLSIATQVPMPVLEGARSVVEESVAARMAWAANRQTVLVEDRAYSLMGLFDVSMPILYGEGPKAFQRLQEEIIRNSDDLSIFCWKDAEVGTRLHGLMADSPKAFLHSAGYRAYAFEDVPPFDTNNRGVRLSVHLTPMKDDLVLAALPCPDPATQDGYLAIYLRKLPTGDKQYARVRCHEITVLGERGTLEQIYVRQVLPPSIVRASVLSGSSGGEDGKSAAKHKESVLPTHLFHLSKFKTWDGYKVIDVHYQPPKVQLNGFGELANELKHPENVSGQHHVTFKMVKADHRLTAVILLGRDDDDNRIALLLGSGADCEPGFDIVECRDLQDLRECYRPFEPMPFGTMAFGKRHRVVVRAEPVVRQAVKVYKIELIIGALSRVPNMGPIERVDSKRSSISSKRMSWIVQKVVRKHSQISNFSRPFSQLRKDFAPVSPAG